MHEITTNERGLVEAMYAERPAWHRLGTVLDDAPTSRDAILAANLDWEVEKVPLALRKEGSPLDGLAVEDRFALARSDERTVLGTCSDRYVPIQNREAFAFLDGFVEDGELRYESAGSLRGGEKVWMLARIPGHDFVAEGDALLRYLLFTSGHDGKTGFLVTPTSTRVMCANTLRVAIEGKRALAHTGDVERKMKLMREYLVFGDGGLRRVRPRRPPAGREAGRPRHGGSLLPDPAPGAGPPQAAGGPQRLAEEAAVAGADVDGPAAEPAGDQGDLLGGVQRLHAVGWTTGATARGSIRKPAGRTEW